MLVRSKDRFEQLADFDHRTGQLTTLHPLHHGAPAGRPEGSFADLDGTPAVFYRLDSDLWLRLGDVCCNLDADNVQYRFSASVSDSHITLTCEGQEVANVVYKPYRLSPDDPTPMAEQEDFDFGMFVWNVLGNEGRRRYLYTSVDRPD